MLFRKRVYSTTKLLDLRKNKIPTAPIEEKETQRTIEEN